MKQFLLIILILCLSSSAFSQIQNEDSGIVKTMQRLADTTIILQYPSVWSRGPKIQLLSKKGDTINIYDYKQPKYTLKINSALPKAMARAIYGNHYNEFWKESVSINRFFRVVDKSPDSLRLIWKQVIKLRPWKINDDAIDGEGCPLVKGKGVMTIDDAGGIYILLVTKTFIKPLNFYAPHDFEKHCPGRKGRQAAIKLSSMFYNVFKE